MLQTYLMATATWWAVLLPAALSAWAFWATPFTAAQWRTWGACTLLSAVLARWELTDEVQQLFIIPVMLLWVVLTLYRRRPCLSRQAYAACFTSLWVVDMAQAGILQATGRLDNPEFYAGVGGAGYLDGLFVFPAIAAALPFYARLRGLSPPLAPQSAQE